MATPPPRTVPWVPAAAAAWVAATAAGLPGFDRDSIRIPLLAIVAIGLAGGAIAHGIRRGEWVLRREPVLAVGGAAWIVAAVSYVAHRADPAGLGPLTLGAAGLVLYTVVSRGLGAREATLRAGFVALAGVGAAALAAGPTGLIGNSSEAGCFWAMAAAALLFRGGAFGIGAGALCAAGVWWSGSRAGMTALAAAGGVVAFQFVRSFLMRSVLSVAFGSAATAGLLLAMGVASFEVRLGVWSGVRELAVDHPLGVGPGRFREGFVPYRTADEYRASHAVAPTSYQEVNHAHNAYLQALAETGWAGGVLRLFLMYVLLRRWLFFMDRAVEPAARAWTRGAGAGIVAFAVGSLAHDLGGSAAHAAVFWFLAAALELAGNRRPMARPLACDGLSFAVPAAAILMLAYSLGLLVPAAAATREFHTAMRTADREARQTGLERARDANPRDWRVRLPLADLLLLRGMKVEAAAELEAGLRERPNHVPMKLMLALARAQIDADPAPALAMINEAEQLAPRYYWVHLQRGRILTSEARFSEALVSFLKAVELCPQSGDALFLRGLCARSMGDPRSEEWFNDARRNGFDVDKALKAIEKDPGPPP